MIFSVRRSIFVSSAAALLFLFPLSVFGQSDPKKPEKGTQEAPVQVHGDAVDYFHEDQKVIGTGHVTIDYQGVQLAADKITVYLATKDALAEGHVLLTQNGNTFSGDRLQYNFGTKVGDVSHMSMVVQPSFYGKAKRIEQISENHYRASDSYITTCCGDSPLYKIQGQQVDIYPNDKVVIRNAVLLVRNVPILFIPYFVQYLVDFDRLPAQLIPGKSSEWGPFLLSKWRYRLVNEPSIHSSGNVLLDYRSKRGFGAGAENFYRGDNIGRGSVRVYQTDDNNPPVGYQGNRYRVQWRHQSKIGEDTTMTTEINKLSDDRIIKDFFYSEEYEQDVLPDNYISVITNKPEYTFSILERPQVNDFFNTVQRNPELRFDTHNRQFMDTPFYLRQEVQFTDLQKHFAGLDDELSATRLDTNHTLSYAGRVGPVSVTPHIGTRQTYYSRDLNAERNFIRGIFDTGADVSVKFYKTYDVYINAFGLDYNKIRHVFTPTVSYGFRPDPTVLNTKLQQFDALDALDKQNLMRFSFENKFQTKEHAGRDTYAARDIARIVPFFDQNFDTGAVENVGIDVELRPYSWMGIVGDASYDRKHGYFDTADLDFNFTRGNINFGVGQRYVRDESSQTTGQVTWQFAPEWNLKVYERYEFETRQSQEFQATLSRTFSCVILDMTYDHRYNAGDSFFFVLKLKAFPNIPFAFKKSYNAPRNPEAISAPGV